jgi:hypothetical protein
VDVATRVISQSEASAGYAGPDPADRNEVVFRVQRPSDFLSLAGTVNVSPAKRDVAWDEVIRRTRAARAAGGGR